MAVRDSCCQRLIRDESKLLDCAKPTTGFVSECLLLSEANFSVLIFLFLRLEITFAIASGSAVCDRRSMPSLLKVFLFVYVT